jgi:hypothetical protein
LEYVFSPEGQRSIKEGKNSDSGPIPSAFDLDAACNIVKNDFDLKKHIKKGIAIHPAAKNFFEERCRNPS